MTEIIETRYISIKTPPKIVDLLRDTQNFPFVMAQCCAKPEEAMPGIAGRE